MSEPRTIKTKINRDGVRYNFLIAKNERACSFGDKINAGDRYLRVYNVKDNVIASSTVYCHDHFKICGNCGTFVLDLEKRFCSDVCAEAHLERETQDHDENMFYGRGAEDSGW
jgi:hypothetical protein